MNKRIAYGLILATAWLLAMPVFAQEAVSVHGPASATPLVIHGTTDINVFDPVLAEFSNQRPDLAIRYEQWGSNALYQQAEQACRQGRGQADLLISSAIDQQLRLVNDGCAQPHSSTWTEQIEPALNWRDELFGVTREPAVIVYNRTLLNTYKPPRSRFDLLDLLRTHNAALTGKVATYDIEQSGLGYLFAFADAQQATTFGALLEAFGRTDAQTACCSASIIDAVAEGKLLLAYNMLGSYALARAAADPRIVVVAPSDYTLILSRAALIPAQATQAAAAAQLIDFLLSPPGVAALTRSRLVVSFGNNGDERDNDFTFLDGSVSVLRPIPFSPRLLVGLDQHKRRLFIEQWREKLRP